ncbi:MAG: acyl-ACP thioesterase domain-containing protein [Candidatus Limnocylindrales bacterium]
MSAEVARHDPANDHYAPPAETDRLTSVPYRVRFEEAGPDGIARASTYLRYAQDVAWVHSERRGFDRPWYLARGLAWIVRAVELTIERPLPTGAGLIATTEVTGGRRVMARRRCDLRAETDGTPIATVITDWVMTTTAGAPTRVPEAFPISFGVPLDTFQPIRVDPGDPPADAISRPFEVRLHELDPMGHVNNAVYLDWLDEAIEPLDSVAVRRMPRRYRLEYRLAAAPGASLVGRAWRSESGWSYRLDDPAGRVSLGGQLQAVPVA